MSRTAAIAAAIAGLLAGTLLAGAGVYWWNRRHAPPPVAAHVAPRIATGTPVPHVPVTLFDPADDGVTLAPVLQQIPASPSATDHARTVVETAIERGARPDVGLWPAGTVLRAYLAGADGEILVDLTGLPGGTLGGGSTAERLAIGSLVSAIAANVPGATRVRLLVDGHAAATLAAHVDARTGFAADRQALRPAPPLTPPSTPGAP